MRGCSGEGNLPCATLHPIRSPPPSPLPPGLSVDERKKCAEAWIVAGKKHGVKITNHIGAASLTDTCELAKHAEEIGCLMICVMPP